MSKRDDKQRKAMFAKIKNGVTPRKFKRLEDLPEDFKERSNKKQTGKGNFEERKQVLTKKGVENKAPKHRETAIKWALKDTLRTPMKVQKQSFTQQRDVPLLVLKTAIEFAEPIAPIIGEMIGLEEPVLITKEVINSFESSIDVYEKTKNIDEAIVSGVKSFVINFAKDKMESYMKSVVSIDNNNSDREFEAALKGSILMTSFYSIIENVEGIISKKN